MGIRHRQQGAGGSAMARAGGFTLVEVVVTIVVAAILSVGIFTYIGDAVDGFTASGNRNRLASSGRTVVDRIALELRNAVPNSVRVTGAQPGGDQCLEYMPFTGATTYLDAPFTGQGDDEFDAVDFSTGLTLAPPAGVYAVIYPDTTGALYGPPESPGALARVDEVADPDEADGRVTVRLEQQHRFSRRSPVERLYLGEDPVSFCIEGGNMYRYADYGLAEAQCTPQTCLPNSVPGRARVGENLDNAGLQGFMLLEPTLRRNAIVRMELNFTDAGDTVRLHHELVMRNVP